tara:strand:- start:2494 stop:3240 length:747 start_codon:yes stop_codon:yes gene_type:complete
MSRIDDLLSEIKGGEGLALANRYRVFLPPVAGASPRSLNLLCKNVSIPGKQITSADYMLGTTNRKIANGVAFSEVTMTFIGLNDFMARKYFDTWQGQALNPETLEIGYYNDYTKPVVIQQIEKNASQPPLGPKQVGEPPNLPDGLKSLIPSAGPIDFQNGTFDLGLVGRQDLGTLAEGVNYSVRLNEAYPTTLSEIPLSNDQDGLVEITVQLSFKDFVVVEGTIKDKLTNKLIEKTGLNEIFTDGLSI